MGQSKIFKGCLPQILLGGPFLILWIDILQNNLNVLAYAKIVKSDIYHDIRTMILALDHPTCVALSFLMNFLAATQYSVQLLF